MAILRVSVFQKDLTEKLNLSTSMSLSQLKSDFLLLPEYFYADPSVTDHKTLLEVQERSQNWLLNLSKSYKGSIIGGAFAREKGKLSHIGIPIIQKGQIIDWYNKRKLNAIERKIASPAPAPESNEGIFILGGARFAALTYGDSKGKGFWERLLEEKVKLVFLLSNFETPAPREKIRMELIPIAKKYNLNMVLCCGVGKSFQFSEPLGGCSSVITPYGLSWQVSTTEEKKQFLKTLMLNHLPS